MNKAPFDAQKATRSIVRVKYSAKRWSCGFVVADAYVITAAHCLPRRPRHHVDDHVTATIRSWDGSDETTLVVIYCDILSDIAILASNTFLGDQLPSKEWWWGFVCLVDRAGSADIDLSFPVQTIQPFYIRTHEGVWLTGATEKPREFCHGLCFDAVLDEGEGVIPGGTSGSPVFNQRGEVIGLVSSIGPTGVTYVVTCPWLASALPRWYIGEIEAQRAKSLLGDEGA